MKYLVKWTNWRVNEAVELEAGTTEYFIQKGNIIFENWILEKLKKNLKIETNKWEIPYYSVGGSKQDEKPKEGSFEVKATTAQYENKRFFIGLLAPVEHGETGSAAVISGPRNIGWGQVFYWKGASQAYQMMAHFYSGEEVKLEEPNAWFDKPPYGLFAVTRIAVKSVNKIKNILTKKMPPKKQIVLTDLALIVNSMLKAEVITKEYEGVGFWRQRTRNMLDGLMEKLKNHIAKECGDNKLLDANSKEVESPYYFVYPYCNPRK